MNAHQRRIRRRARDRYWQRLWAEAERMTRIHPRPLLVHGTVPPDAFVVPVRPARRVER